jgi:hypothetical protein
VDLAEVKWSNLRTPKNEASQNSTQKNQHPGYELYATAKFASKIEPLSGPNTYLLHAKNTFEWEALSLFEFALSC